MTLAAAADKTVLFDTSVLVAALVEGHPAHERCRPWLSQKLQVDVLLTLNLRDFRRVWLDDDGVIREK